MIEPTQEQVNSACLSYRHDYGLLSEGAQKTVQYEAREWLHAWRKEGLGLAQQPGREKIMETLTALVNDGQVGFLSVRHAYKIADAIAALTPGNGAVEADDGLDKGTITRNLRGLASRMQYRVEAIEARDGKGADAITGKGVGIGYLLAKDLADGLTEAATFIEALPAAPSPAALDPVTVEALKRARPIIHDLATSLPRDADYKEALALIDRALIGHPASKGEPVPSSYTAPFKISGSCIWDARDNYVAELSAVHGPDQRDKMLQFLVNAANTYASPSNPQETDPEVIWDAYCDEVPNPDDRSPQGAMAFALDAVSSTDEVKS